MSQDLASFLERVAARVDEAVAHPSFHASQRDLLRATVSLPRARSQSNPFADPLALVYLVARAYGAEPTEQAERVGAFCLLYVLSLDLFDDVQDDDLEGKPHAEAGVPIAVNSAIALGFLATDQLRRALELEPSAERRLSYLRLYNRVSLQAVSGQHRDLMGERGAGSPAEVLAMQQAKTSSVALLAECGALLGGARDVDRARLRAFGEKLALFVQIRDDLRDLFGKTVSPDLATGKLTFPVACFAEIATGPAKARFAQLKAALPGSLRDVRSLFYDCGVVARCATELERLRRGMHEDVAATDNTSAYLRTLLDLVDRLAEAVYSPRPLAISAALRQPAAGYHERVRAELERFTARMAGRGMPAPPSLRPWHRPHWMCEPGKTTIFYPDLEELSSEVVPFQAALLGAQDEAEVVGELEAQIPAVLAHEMFHFWRWASGRLTQDHWHEEWAANRLAVAYARVYAPEALRSSLALADRVCGRFAGVLEAHAPAILARCHRAGSTTGYGMGMLAVGVVELDLVRRLAREPLDLRSEIASLVSCADRLAS